MSHKENIHASFDFIYPEGQAISKEATTHLTAFGGAGQKFSLDFLVLVSLRTIEPVVPLSQHLQDLCKEVGYVGQVFLNRFSSLQLPLLQF